MAVLREVSVLDADERCPVLPIIEGRGVARAVVWPGVGARLRSMHRISLAPKAQTIALRHPMEAVYFVVTGGGTALDARGGGQHPLVQGAMVHVEPGTVYQFRAGEEGIELLGGPCPADLALYQHLDADAQGADRARR
jgi:quercetin dioxygenase-like cupin family protein